MPATSGWRPTRPRSARWRASVDDAGGVRVLPALAGLGAPWWQPERARRCSRACTGGHAPAHIARAALEAIAWRVADIVDAVRERVAVEELRVDGGLTQRPAAAAAAGRRGRRAGRAPARATRPRAGAAALAAVGAGVWAGGVEAIGEHVTSRAPIRPRRDSGWRAREHAAWRRFVEAASRVANETMSQDTDDRDDVGAEGGDNENADTLPAVPSEDDDTPLGDTDQHSSAPPTEHDKPKD